MTGASVGLPLIDDVLQQLLFFPPLQPPVSHGNHAVLPAASQRTVTREGSGQRCSTGAVSTGEVLFCSHGYKLEDSEYQITSAGYLQALAYKLINTELFAC